MHRKMIFLKLYYILFHILGLIVMRRRNTPGGNRRNGRASLLKFLKTFLEEENGVHFAANTSLE